MNEILRILDWNHDQAETSTRLLTREWIVTNGLGGYASGTVSGIPTRRYHGLLVAALPAPLGRIMMLNRMAEQVRLPDGTSIRLGGLERKSGLRLHPLNVLDEFRLESGLPVWRYRVGPALLEKRVLLLHHQNTTHVSYRLLEGCERIRLTVRLGLNIRPHDDPVNVPLKRPYQLTLNDDRFEIQSGAEIPPLRLHVWAKRSKTILAPGVMKNVYYRIEAGRGYTDTGEFWTPGAIQLNLRDQEVATIGLSAEEWPTFLALPPDEALAAEQTRRARLIASAVPCVREGLGAELVLAADQFLISPVSRTADATRVQAAGDEARTVIAGYHWFTDWGRDTMISLEGLTLMTGRPHEAESILRTFSHYVRDGLIPNFFPDGENEGLYH
ncbi:MAG: glycogen debranching enzyme N-terminal domain-containing protein, partial [Isosphaeraceae bacterium]